MTMRCGVRGDINMSVLKPSIIVRRCVGRYVMSTKIGTAKVLVTVAPTVIYVWLRVVRRVRTVIRMWNLINMSGCMRNRINVTPVPDRVRMGRGMWDVIEVRAAVVPLGTGCFCGC